MKTRATPTRIPPGAPPEIQGDRAFVGLNQRLDPGLLQPGYVAEARNARCRNGVYESRKGYARLIWTQRRHLDAAIVHSGTAPNVLATVTTTVSHGLATGDTVAINGCTDPLYNGVWTIIVTGATTFTYALGSDHPAVSPAAGIPAVYSLATYRWGEVHGVATYSDPYTGLEYLVIAADGAVFAACEQNSPQRLNLPTGVTITGLVEFTQAFDKLIMWRGFDLPPLVMPRISDGFQAIDQTDSGDGTEPIPNSDHGLFFQNRVWIPNDRDELAYSDLGDYTRYAITEPEFRLNQGSADAIVGITKFGEVSIVVGKAHRIVLLTGVYGNLQAVQQDELTDAYGLIHRKTFAKCGKDLWFLSELGVMSIGLTEQNKLQGTVRPISEDIQPYIDRINWTVARSTARAAYWDSKYYLAVPLDAAEKLDYNLVPNQAMVGTTVQIAVTSGAVYRLTFGANDTQLVNGGNTYAQVDYPTGLDFTAAGTSVTLTKTTALAPTATLRRVYRNVNTHLLVYDFMNGAWVSVDDAEGLIPTDLFTFKVQGRDRLLVINADGNVWLYEDDYEDALAVVYTDLTLTALPLDADYFWLNNALVTITCAGTTDATHVKITASTLAEVQNRLWLDATGAYGFYPYASTGPWTPNAAPNVFPVKIAGGVRFYSTNGELPTVFIRGTGAASFEVVQQTTQPVQFELVTRGYRNGVADQQIALAAILEYESYNPTLTVDIRTPGVEESGAVLSGQTRDRTLYTRPWNAAAWTETNTGDDFLTAYREDYSVPLKVAGIQLNSGIKLGMHQAYSQRILLPTDTYEYAQAGITNTTGRIRCKAVRLETQARQAPAGRRT